MYTSQNTAKTQLAGLVGLLICPLAFSTVGLVVTYSVHTNNDGLYQYIDGL